MEVLEERATKDFEMVKAQEVKKLLAMRALGQMKDKAALPALQKAAGSKKLFFSEYASEAIAVIEGKEFVENGLDPALLKRDLALLPAGIGLVVQARLESGGSLDLKKVVGDAFAGQDGVPSAEEMLKQVNEGLGEVFKGIGNVRLDAVTMGVSADVGDDSGFVIIIARGKYDHRAMESYVSRQAGTKPHSIGGTMFLGLDGDDAALAPVSNELLILVSGPGWDQFPLDAVAAKLKERPVEPVFSKELQKVLARADQSGEVWGGGLISAGMKEAPPLAPFDEFVLSTSKLEVSGKNRMKLDVVGSDPKAVKASIDEMKQQVGEGIAEFEQVGRPGMESMLELMKGMKFYSMGLNGTISVTFDGNVLGLLVPMMRGF
ncbi:MAG: hypothetical protein ACI9MB_001241 [Verrucomicrobiales bacterium]